jgi:alpha-tubulin suppressor-like RCC1 family protein
VAGIAAGADHTCAVTITGRVKCWGSNAVGQLGIGSTGGSSPTPVDVSGLTAEIVTVSAGFHHSCALSSTGAAWCWGEDSHGQLGDGKTCGFYPYFSCTSPAPVVDLPDGVSLMTGGVLHSCGLTNTGSVKCWGEGARGQVGYGGTYGSYVPIGVSGLSSEMAGVAAGGFHSCAVTRAGVVKCWGANSSGQLGDGTSTDRLTPVTVVSAAPAKCIVPNVRGKTLAAAKRAIKRASCRVGGPRKAYSSRVRKGKVFSQHPAAGTELDEGGAVSLVVSKGKRKKR